MKRKHEDSDLNDLRRRAGELVARAGLENGEVKEQMSNEKTNPGWLGYIGGYTTLCYKDSL